MRRRERRRRRRWKVKIKMLKRRRWRIERRECLWRQVIDPKLVVIEIRFQRGQLMYFLFGQRPQREPGRGTKSFRIQRESLHPIYLFVHVSIPSWGLSEAGPGLLEALASHMLVQASQSLTPASLIPAKTFQMPVTNEWMGRTNSPTIHWPLTLLSHIKLCLQNSLYSEIL